MFEFHSRWLLFHLQSAFEKCSSLQAVQLLEQAFADVESDDQMDEASVLKTC